MRLPDNENLIRLSEEVLKEFDKAFGLHPGRRPAHAKGVFLTGEFTPGPQAQGLTNAPHVL